MYPVVFTPEAEAQLTELHRYIAEAGSPSIAARFTDAIVTYCEGLAQFPLRGTSRDEIRPGLRTTSYKKRTVIAFAVLDDKLAIIGIFYGGRDCERILRDASTETDDPDETSTE
jgi:plasmid stabilization system protein ParE